MEYQTTMNYPLSILRLLGLHSKTYSKKVVIVATICSALLSYFLLAALMQYTNIKNVFDFIENLESICGYVQILGKIVGTAYHQKNILKLLYGSRNFWRTSICEEKLKVRFDRMLTNSSKVQKLFVRGLLTVSVLSLMALFFGRTLPFGIWKLEGYDTLYKITLILQIATTPATAYFLAAFDTLFLASSLETVLQFKILRCYLRNLNITQDDSERSLTQNKIKMCVGHHIFLLQTLKLLQEIYAPIIFLEYVTLPLALCSEMYAVFQSPTIEVQLRCAFVYVILIFQMAVYCVTVDFLIVEAATTAEGIYLSDWYSRYLPSLRKQVILMVQNSNRQIVFTAGLFEVNARNLITVMKLSWSACTIARGLKR